MPIIITSEKDSTKEPDKEPEKETLKPKDKDKAPKCTDMQEIDVVFICDVSGSMQHVQPSLTSWMNECVRYLKMRTPMARFSLIVYASLVKCVYWRIPVVFVPRFNSMEALRDSKDAGGTEATWDAIGSAITRMEEEAPNTRCFFFLQTDFGSDMRSLLLTHDDVSWIAHDGASKHAFAYLTTYFEGNGINERLMHITSAKNKAAARQGMVAAHTTEIDFYLGPNNMDPAIMGII